MGSTGGEKKKMLMSLSGREEKSSRWIKKKNKGKERKGKES